MLHCPFAAVTVTADGPVTTNSVPFGDIEVQSSGSVKLSVTEEGEQVTADKVPSGNGGWGNSANVVAEPAMTCRPH